jgi:hypothetical protein
MYIVKKEYLVQMSFLSLEKKEEWSSTPHNIFCFSIQKSIAAAPIHAFMVDNASNRTAVTFANVQHSIKVKIVKVRRENRREKCVFGLQKSKSI